MEWHRCLATSESPIAARYAYSAMATETDAAAQSPGAGAAVGPDAGGAGSPGVSAVHGRYGESDAVEAFNGIWKRLVTKLKGKPWKSSEEAIEELRVKIFPGLFLNGRKRAT
jgi:hypothetical protein